MAVSFIPTSSTSLLRRPPPRIRSENHAPISRIKASWQEVAGVMVFSAIPFTAVKAIANSPLGVALQRQMEQKKKLYAENSSKFKALAEKAREEREIMEFVVPNTLVLFSTLNLKGLDCLLFTNLRGVKPYAFKRDESGSQMHIGFVFMLKAIGKKEGNVECPAKLSGSILQNFCSLEGDGCFCNHYGLSQDPVALQKYFNFEVLHARWAMLAALGVVIPEILDLLGAFQFVEPVWWRVGYSKLKGDTLDYLGIPGLHVAGSQGVIIIAICQALLMVGPEYARYCGIEALEPLGIYLPGDINYPGGILFDPLNISKDPVAFEELKVKEIKNGRLAMVAWLGFYAQAAVTGKGPVQNLLDHISDPFQNNLISTLKSLMT